MSLLMQKLNVTLEQRLQKAYSKILSHQEFRWLAGVMMIGTYDVVEDGHAVTTAATNGKDVWYNRTFCEGYGDAEVRFIVLHETYHKLYQHLIVWAHLWKIDADVANRAMDYAINQRIIDTAARIARNEGQEFIKEPLKDGKRFMCYDTKFRDWDEAKIFYYLLDEKKKGGGQGQPPPGQGAGQGQESLDTHDWEGAQSMGEEERKELTRQVEEAIRQGKAIADANGSGAGRQNEELNALIKPQINWRDVLRNWAKQQCRSRKYSTWARPNRRFMASGLRMPKAIGTCVGEAVFAVDRSGSVYTPENLVKFVSEIQSICTEVKPKKVHMVYWDTEINQHEVYEQHELSKLVSSTKPCGGGGTTVSCVTEMLKAKKIKPQFVIVFTDGYVGGDWGVWPCPVLWCILDNKRAMPPSGKVLHIDSSTLR